MAVAESLRKVLRCDCNVYHILVASHQTNDKVFIFIAVRWKSNLLEHKVLLCHDLAKQLSHYLYFLFFSFSFLLDLLHRRECRKVSHHKCHKSQSHHMMSHDKCGKVVHRPCSSCISSVGKSNRDSIEFSLSITEQRAVGFIPAWSLAFLHTASAWYIK